MPRLYYSAYAVLRTTVFNSKRSFEINISLV